MLTALKLHVNQTITWMDVKQAIALMNSQSVLATNTWQIFNLLKVFLTEKVHYSQTYLIPSIQTAHNLVPSFSQVFTEYVPSILNDVYAS